MNHSIHYNEDGDFTVVKNADVLQIQVTGYDSKEITDEEAATIQEQISLHTKSKLMYNGQQIVKKPKNKETKNG